MKEREERKDVGPRGSGFVFNGQTDTSESCRHFWWAFSGCNASLRGTGHDSARHVGYHTPARVQARRGAAGSVKPVFGPPIREGSSQELDMIRHGGGGGGDTESLGTGRKRRGMLAGGVEDRRLKLSPLLVSQLYQIDSEVCFLHV